MFQSESLASGDEILVWQSQLKDTTDMDTGDENFWTSYLKGACRCGTLLFLLAMVRSAGWELAVLHPMLYETVCVVNARCDSCFLKSLDQVTIISNPSVQFSFMLLKFVHSNQGADAQTAAYQNAMLSQAGSIRRAHDIPTWLAKIQTMCQSGMSADAIIRTWNSRSSKEGQLQGAKRTCLLNLLQYASLRKAFFQGMCLASQASSGVVA